MQNNPQMVLNRLKKYSTTQNPKFRRLYANLYSVEFFKLAYSHIYSKPGNMTPASDGSTIDGMSLERINKLIQSLKDGTYSPTNLKRINIPKKNGDKRPISIPSFNDKLVQEVIRMILEAIYEVSFSDYSHGFRPNRSCHTALDKVRQQFKGTVWFIEGDIKGCFDNINHEKLLNILREKIYDLRFIHLINLFLKAGYIENWKYHKTYSGVPQGSIISPILANIYLDKFDKYMEERKLNFDRGKNRKTSQEYRQLASSIQCTRSRIKHGINIEKNTERLKERLKIQRRGQIKCTDPMDKTYRRLHYIRYADDFIIGVVGSKQEAIDVKTNISNWMKNNLTLDLSERKTKITHNSKKIRFLGYDIISVRNSQKKFDNGNIKLSVPYEKMISFIIDNRFGKWWKNPKSNKDEFKAVHKSELINSDELEILQLYNAKLRGIYNYYSLAENVYKIGSFYYICLTSFMRTLAVKYKTSRRKLYNNKKYCHNKFVGITYKDKFYELFHGPFQKLHQMVCTDLKPSIAMYTKTTSLINRLEAKKCEFCGNEQGPFEVHHVKKLKDLKNKKYLDTWEKLMISRQRKTLVLCTSCHHKLHAGKL